MLSALPILMALKLGTVVALPGSQALMLRVDARSPLTGGAQALALRTTAAWEVNRALEWQEGRHGVAPLTRPYTSEEWVNAVARGLDLSEGKVLDAARFLVTMPVQVDVRPRRLMVRVRVGSF